MNRTKTTRSSYHGIKFHMIDCDNVRIGTITVKFRKELPTLLLDMLASDIQQALDRWDSRVLLHGEVVDEKKDKDKNV